ncbi:peptide deformylase [Neotamlana laminarinivorans]|uniref:Peptide deformylase n=1 Tax=Neotamlana laminarinivorans TaxID=2883124 RepID=A0A9X1I1W1_9FLAO|nr:peptide deformylase [Tamlana laminarinivorans]MCB4799900.1 peptide deformylase [Tamlana laminarinivorans]
MKTIYASLLVVLLITSCSIAKSSVKNAFSKKELKLINSGTSNTPMRVYKITNKTDSLLLRKKSSYINPEPKNEALQLFVNRLYATVTDSTSLGVGIAAPQVGVLKNIIWVQRLDKENTPFEVYLNPKIIEYSTDKQTVTEGCLSIPNRKETLNSRSKIIDIEYDALNGQHKTETIEGFVAVIFQHEIDHLNGIIYLDHLNKELKDSKTKP